jgi:ribosome-binding protein aMBF1 (putative translation factor)
MNTSLRHKNEIQQAFREILTPASDKEKLDLETLMLMTGFLSEIEKVCEERGLLKKDLANMIGTSASYVTQLFRGHKIINLETIAKIMLALDIRFDISVRKNNNKTALSGENRPENPATKQKAKARSSHNKSLRSIKKTSKVAF